MKKSIFLLFALCLTIVCNAQPPQGINYQGVARNSSGAILANQPIRLRISIRDSVAAGSIVYRETFLDTTNSLGLFDLVVGTGSIVSGTFNSINWGRNNKFMQVELDPTGGTSYGNMGTTQMMAVPYALFSGSATNVSGGGQVLLNSFVVSGVTSVIFDNTYLNSVYNSYAISLSNISNVSGPIQLYFQVSTNNGSSYLSSSGDYDGHFLANSHFGVGTHGMGIGRIDLMLPGARTTTLANYPLSANFIIDEVNSANYKIVTGRSVHKEASGAVENAFIEAFVKTTSSINAVRIQSSLGSFSGTIKIYGIK